MAEEEHPLPQDALLRLEASTAPAEVRRIASELLPPFYHQLRRVAHRTRARFGAGHTLQTTALVHEAYLRLGQSRSFADETHFLRASALAMRHAVINHAQSRLAEKRGGGGQHLTLSHVADLSIDSDCQAHAPDSLAQESRGVVREYRPVHSLHRAGERAFQRQTEHGRGYSCK